MRKNYLYWLLPLTWMVLIFYSSSQPYDKQDIKPMLSEIMDLSFLEPFFNRVTFYYNGSEISVAALGINGFIEFFIRKGAHFGAYFILILLIYIAMRKTISWNSLKILVVSLFITLAYAITDEIHQGFTPNRTPLLTDVFIDGIGALTASLILFIRMKRKE